MPYPYSFPLISPGDEVTAEQANEMHQAHVDNNVPTSIDDYSQDVTQMRLVEDPGNDGAENLPVDLAGEIKRLRNEIKVIKSYIAQTAPSYWYSKIASANRVFLLRDGTLAMTGKIPAKSGAGGVNNPNNCGVVFDTDADSGLFGISDGVVGVYADGVEFLEVNKPADLIKTFRPILFPSTQVSSSDPNALDDYEEGTWTPFFTRSTTDASLTYNIQNGMYLKIGRLVIVEGRIQVNTVVSQGSGFIIIGGLPFPISDTSRRYISPIYLASWSAYTGGNPLAVSTYQGSQNYLALAYLTPFSGGVSSYSFSNSMDLSFSYTYIAVA
jgi:hypothetical protein